MAQRVVGLDIGTHAVRAAELSLGRGGNDATLTRFAQVALPVGAVVDGEVVDPGLVATSLRRLWTEGGFKSRRVVLGVGNQRVVVRQADLPQMSEDELRSALQFEAQELIPIPMDEAILDFDILEQIASNDAGDPMMRVLLVAAHRDMVANLVTAATEAGLTPDVVDVVPFALIRAVGDVTPPPLLDDEPRTSEAIVGIGGGVTNVVVHEGGVPRFVRILATGGAGVTQAIADELDVDPEMAEDLKRRADLASSDALEARAGRVVADRTTPLVEEIRGSLDFYLAQNDATPISRVLVTGGGSRTPQLLARLTEQLRLPVERAHPLERVAVGRTGIPETDLVDAEPLLATPIGLALAGRRSESGTGRRLSVLPREVEIVREQRRQSLVVAGGVGAFAALLLAIWVAQNGKVNDERHKADQAEAEVAQLRRQTASLQDATQLQTQLDQRRQTVTAALTGDIAWTRLIQQIATVIPNDVWLTSFTGSTANGQGTVNFAAMGFDHTSAARWLLRVGELPSITNLWLPSSAKQGEGASALVTFSSTATLTPAAASDRLQRYTGESG
ncbi:MAG TPA: type IV pilus assembly protein PilM [Acidimicrobiales bacterium]|jgi:type IV pilus assembly protein PilM|nr:type IV pilus assembly protein PilM [Acidimicrobiales bacterium]